MSVLIAILGGVAWCVVVPPLLRIRHPRLDERNPDHFQRLVRFHRSWGLGAVLVGVTVAWVL